MNKKILESLKEIDERATAIKAKKQARINELEREILELRSEISKAEGKNWENLVHKMQTKNERKNQIADQILKYRTMSKAERAIREQCELHGSAPIDNFHQLNVARRLEAGGYGYLIDNSRAESVSDSRFYPNK